jgi:hypothetical protein
MGAVASLPGSSPWLHFTELDCFQDYQAKNQFCFLLFRCNWLSSGWKRKENPLINHFILVL